MENFSFPLLFHSENLWRMLFKSQKHSIEIQNIQATEIHEKIH